MTQGLAGFSRFYSHSNRYSFYGRPLTSQGPVTSSTQQLPPNSTSTATRVSSIPPGVTTTAASRTRQRHSTLMPIHSSQQMAPARTGTIRSRRQPPVPSDNILFEVEYQQEALEYMHVLEKHTMANVELMNMQPELHWFMRPYLVDFLIEIHQSFRLRPETLYLTMNLVDRYVSKRIVYKRHYQLVGCAALLIAAKFEDAKDRVPTVQELSQMCCNAYDPSAFTQMEGHVLSTLGWQLGHPTAESWLRYEYSCAPPSSPATHNVARFLLEVTLFHESFLTLPPSSLAAGAMLFARHICRDSRPQPQPLDVLVTNVMTRIHNFIADHLNELSSILIKKYSYSYYTEASTVVLDWFRKHLELKKAMEAIASPMHVEVCSSDDENESNRSNESVTSIFSTPSRSITRDEDDDDNSMPLTPLSLHTAQDPSVYAVNMKNPVHVSRFAPSTAGPTGRPVSTTTTTNEKASVVTASWMSLAQLRPVAKHPKTARVEMESTIPESST